MTGPDNRGKGGTTMETQNTAIQNSRLRRRMFVVLTSAFLAVTASAPAWACVVYIQKPGH
jgi:hypothetical protein